MLGIFADLVKTVRSTPRSQELRAILAQWKDMADMTSRLLTLCNSFSSHDLREACLTAVKEMLLLWPNEVSCSFCDDKFGLALCWRCTDTHRYSSHLSNLLMPTLM